MENESLKKMRSKRSSTSVENSTLQTGNNSGERTVSGIGTRIVTIIHSYTQIWIYITATHLQMGISVTTCFIICWTPYAITSMLETYGYSGSVSPQMEGASALFAKSSTAFTPLVHLLFNKKYRRWLKMLMCCCFYELMIYKQPTEMSSNSATIEKRQSVHFRNRESFGISTYIDCVVNV